jgi:hypothetical protein
MRDHVPAMLDAMPVRVGATEAWCYSRITGQGAWMRLDMMSAHGASLMSEEHWSELFFPEREDWPPLPAAAFN